MIIKDESQPTTVHGFVMSPLRANQLGVFKAKNQPSKYCRSLMDVILPKSKTLQYLNMQSLRSSVDYRLVEKISSILKNYHFKRFKPS